MLRKSVAAGLAAVLLLICGQPARASSNAEKQAQLAEKVKTGIFKLGTGKEALVSLKLRDKTKLAGYVSEIKDESFTVTDVKTGATTSVSYGDVTQVKGHNLGTGAKIAIGIAIGVGIALIVLAIYLNCCTG